MGIEMCYFKSRFRNPIFLAVKFKRLNLRAEVSQHPIKEALQFVYFIVIRFTEIEVRVSSASVLGYGCIDWFRSKRQ